MPVRLLVFVVLMVASAPCALAGMIYTAPPEVVARHAEIVVRARVDLEARRVTVVHVYRGKAPGVFEVQNLEDFSMTKDFPGALPPTGEAILFLDELDGRHHLVHTSSPAWIRPHASILFLTGDGQVLHYGQPMSGVLQVMKLEGMTRASLEQDLKLWLAAPRAARLERTSLDAPDAQRLHRLLDPYVDLYLHEVVQEPPGSKLQVMLESLDDIVTSSHGELRRRAVDALLVLASQRGTDQDRRGFVEARLFGMIDRLGQASFLEPCLDEIRSLAVSANKESAAKLLRRMDAEPRNRAKALLLEQIASDRGTLGTQAYFALRDLGFPTEAEAALRARESGAR